MRSTQQSNRYRPRVESLESRRMMAGDTMHNFLAPHDVNDDSAVSPSDALAVINYLNNGERFANGPDDSVGRQRMLDVDDDSIVTPLDALQIVNVLNRSTHSSNEPMGAGQVREAYFTGSNGERARIEYEIEDGEAELSIRLLGGVPSAAYDVFLNDLALGELVVDSRGRGELKLSQADDHIGRPQLPPDFAGITVGSQFVVEGLIDAIIPATNGDDQNTDDRNPVELVARFSTPSNYLLQAEYEVDLRQGMPVREFEVEVERATPGETLIVTIDDVLVATLIADSEGEAKLKFSTAPRDADELPMPSSFPAITVGSSIRIGVAVGVWG